jgi:hypothetical protein
MDAPFHSSLLPHSRCLSSCTVDRLAQPLWPVVPSSLYGAFLAGEAKDARILLITFDSSIDGWGAVVRSSPKERGMEIVGDYILAAPMLGRAFVDSAALPACPASQVYRETLAGFLATRAATSCTPWRIAPS